MRAFVLGHRGMLGHVVARWLTERGAQVLTTDRRHDGTMALAEEVARAGCDAAVSCIATTAPGQMLALNGVWPQQLAMALGGRALLVQPSSDGVFSGAAGPYAADAVPDAADEYGLSKRAGELAAAVPGARACVLRCSIVGPELGEGKSLFAWLSRQRGTVRGFVDRRWNGITTLAWAQLCERAMTGELGPGLHQPACEPAVSKAELLRCIAAAQGWNGTVEEADSGAPVDRRLVPTLGMGTIASQLEALVRWYPDHVR